MINKKASVMMWILIALVLLGAGIGLYFFLSSGAGGIPQPPALPK